MLMPMQGCRAVLLAMKQERPRLPGAPAFWKGPVRQGVLQTAQRFWFSGDAQVVRAELTDTTHCLRATRSTASAIATEACQRLKDRKCQ